jgi:hypothetical protein
MLSLTAMTKVIYLAIVLLLLLPSIFAAAVTVYSVRQMHRIQEDAERGTSDTVYVRGHSTIALGRLRVAIYPHMWAAIALLLGATLWVVAAVFLFFIRQ